MSKLIDLFSFCICLCFEGCRNYNSFYWNIYRAAFEKEIEGLPSTTRSVGDLPPELHCPLCKEVMKDAVLTSKCCFKSFCDKCNYFFIIWLAFTIRLRVYLLLVLIDSSLTLVTPNFRH